METCYQSRNVDLSHLNERLVSFFKKKGFRTNVEKSTNRYMITARSTHAHEIFGVVIVSIFGNSNNFVVKFESGARSTALIKFGHLTSLLGGGNFFLRGLKSREAEERLERKFWVYVEETINFLAQTIQK